MNYQHPTILHFFGIFFGIALTLFSLPVKAQSTAALPTLFLIGDSTVNTPTKDQQGWGDPLAAFFDRTKIKVENKARGGRSSRTFITEGLWDQVLEKMKPGDFVLMQFGHNDGGAVNDTSRARGSIRGTGEETEEIDNLITKKHEIVHSYGWYLRKYISDTKAKGATIIVLSPIPRNNWKDSKVARASKDYGKWAQESAQSQNVLFIDLNEIIARRYEEIGEEKIKPQFFTPADNTHTSPAGARLNAECVVMGLINCANRLKYFLTD